MTPNLEVLVDWVKENYSGYTHLGITNCRRIDDSQTYSQHSWSNAVDIHVSPNLGDQIYADLKEIFEPHLYEVLWRIPAHFDHIHVSCWPKGWLTPPCEGGEQRIKYEDGTVVHGPFPLTIKEEDMPISDEDIARIAEATAKEVWLKSTIPDIDNPGQRTHMSDAVKKIWARAKTAALKPVSSTGATVTQIIDAIKAQWAK